jgi:tRNA dimethylallyltransferase
VEPFFTSGLGSRQAVPAALLCLESADVMGGADRPRVVTIVGPTAVGKTRLALEIGRRLPCEVVSADSRTVYRWMDIGTAKPTLEERAVVAHHLIDVVDPDESYSLAMYQRQARAAIERVASRGRTALLVGGAGLYVSAVCDGLALPEVPPDPAFRASLEHRAETEGWQALQSELSAVDPLSAERIDPKNVRRVIRALEVFHATGRRFSEWQKPSPEHALPCVTVGLQLERPALYARIDARIDTWMATGFVEEVRSLLDRGYSPGLPSMSGLGYREVAQYVRGEVDRETALQRFKNGTHQYAKRQMTWFGARPGIHWLDATTATADAVLKLLQGT